jgi:hypothetical protein
MPAIGAIRWVGAGELVERMGRHDASTVEGTEARLAPGHEAVLRDRAGTRIVSG